MKSDKRILKTLLCLAVLFAVAFSAFYTVAAACHSCVGGGCPVCRQIRLCEELLRLLALALGLAGVVVVGALLCGCRRARCGDRMRVPTLVALRVKLSD